MLSHIPHKFQKVSLYFKKILDKYPVTWYTVGVFYSSEQSKIFCVKCRPDGELPGGRKETAVGDLHPAVAYRVDPLLCSNDA